MSKIVEATISVPQKIEPVEVDESTTQLSQAFTKWKDELPHWKGVPWAQTRKDLVGDFVRATILDLRAMYVHFAPAKAIQMAAVAFAQSGLDALHVQATLSTGQSFVLKASKSPSENELEEKGSSQEEQFGDSESNDEAKVDLVEVEGESEAESETHRAARQFEATALSDDELLHVISQVEDQLVEPLRQKNGNQDVDLDLLVSAAGFWMMFQTSANLNAADSTLSFKGLSLGEQEVAPGQAVIFHGHREMPKPESGRKIKF